MQKNPHQLIEGVRDRRAGGRRRPTPSSSSAASTGRSPTSSTPPSPRPTTAGYLGHEHPRHGRAGRARRPPRRRRLHLRRGDGAARLARGQARQPAAEAAVPGDPGPLRRADADQQRRDALQRPAHRQQRRRLVQELRHRAVAGHQGRLGLRLRPAARQLRDRARDPVAGDHLRPRRRPGRGPRGQGLVSRRLLVAGADPATSSTSPTRFEAMAEAGSMLGSGSIIVADDTVSIPELALRTARFYHHESCGKCTPCREGTNWTVKMLERIARGEATPMDLDIIASVQENIIGNCLCVLGDSMAMPVGAMVAKFRDEFEEAIEGARQAGAGDFDASTVDRPLSDPVAAPMQVSAEKITLVVDGRRGRAPTRARCSSTRPRAATSRSRSSVTSRSSAARSAPAGCAWSRSRASRSCRRPARPRSATAWSSTRRTDRVIEAQNAVVEFLLVNHPLDCPVCDKGGECPLQDIAHRLGPGAQPGHRPEAPLPQADAALAAGADRPRALHPLLPLRALQPGGRRGRAAAAARARREQLRRHVRRPPLHRALPRQHHRALPGRARSPPRPTASARGPGTSRTRARSARSARASATSSSRSATSASSACSPATTTRSTTAGSATRAASGSR